jgi:undecaprenyl-diphosphatase
LDLLQSIVLGIVQGITEFLPISSTAHLALVPWFFEWKDPGLAFNVALHIGTLGAVIYYFWHDWVVIIRDFFRGLLSRGFEKNQNGRLGIYIIIATIPGALSGFIFEEQASTILRHPIAIAVSVLLFGVILYLFDKFSRKEKEIADLNLVDCLVVGIAQAFAIIPGVSRSGVTITGGLIRNLKRSEAARFSFLLSTPLILGALVLESRHLDYATVASPPFMAGVLASAVFGFLSIKYLLRYLQAKTYTVFVVYRIALAGFILFVYLGR